MKTKTIGLMVVLAGLLCSCQQQNQQNSETQGAELEHWNVLKDSISDLKRLQKWDAYVEDHPKDEIGWRNLYEANTTYSYYTKKYDVLEQDGEFMKRVKEAIPDTYTYYLLAMQTSHEYNKEKKYAEEALKRLP